MSTLLLFAVLAVAAPSALTPTELHCAAFGVLAHAITIDRNAGIPLTRTLTTVRTEILPWLHISQAAADALALAIYRDLGHVITPNEARQVAEVGCLTPTPAAPPLEPVRRGKRSEGAASPPR